MNPLAADLEHILDHTREIWEELRGERLFLTGGTGFFGCWLLESFLWANTRLKLGARATLLTRQPEAFIEKAPHLALAESVTLQPGDVRTFDFPTGTFAHFIHAASEVSPKLNSENPLLMLDTLADGTRRTLDFASQCGAKNFLLTSSGAVYGRQPPDLTNIPEGYPGAPDPLDVKSAYGQGKRLAEHLCAQYAIVNRLQPKIARCFAFVGPYQSLDASFATSNFIRDGLRGCPIVVLGDGSALRSYRYAADLAIWLWTILLRGEILRPYNTGSEIPISTGNLAKVVADVFDPVPEIVVEHSGISSDQYVPSTQTARDQLGLFQLIGLETAIQKTVSWHLSTGHPQ